MQDSYLGMPVGVFLLCVAVAVGLLFLYTPKDSNVNKGSLISAFIACIAVGIVLWPVLGPMLSHVTMALYSVK